MPTIKTVKPAGGGDYTSLSSWEDAVEHESSAAQWAECYSGGNLGTVSVSGVDWSTPDSENYPKIYAATGNGHATSTSSGAYIEGSSCITSSLEYLRLEGIRIKNDSTSTYAINFDSVGTSNGCRVDKCLIHGSFQNGIRVSQTSGGSGGTSHIANNIIIIDGDDSNTARGIKVSATSVSVTTYCYIYNNSIYVTDENTTNAKYLISFLNLNPNTLNLTVENNICVGNSYSTSYKSEAFQSGTKTFNNNISSDSTADDFGGSENQINKSSFHIWEDASEENFNLFNFTSGPTKSYSAAINSGKTLAYVTDDILGSARPQGTAYDIGAIEAVFSGATTKKTFDIPTTVISDHEFVADSLIDGPTGQDCSLIYPVTKSSICPNCIYSPRQKKSSNIYKNGGPVPFENHTICPWCGGSGKSSRPIEEGIRLRVYWNPKDWSVTGSIEIPNSYAMVIGYMYDLPKLEKAETIMLNTNLKTYNQWRFERSGEASPWGLAQDKYFSQMLKRIG